VKHSRLVWTAFALWATSGAATLAMACDHDKGASATTASSAAQCSDQMAAHCSAAQAAACKHAGASATTAHMPGGADAATAAATGMCAKSASAMAHCAKGASATAAENCGGAGVTRVAALEAHKDCDACDDMVRCGKEVAAAGGRAQIVPLMNGVMYVYTAESATGIHALQAAIAHRNDRMTELASLGDQAHLCKDCKAMRGAVASGKVTREVVNIEGGCLSLVTSSDPKIVAQLHAMAGLSDNHTKS
jgi:hypothetical protein